jgi:hypothetical protein
MKDQNKLNLITILINSTVTVLAVVISGIISYNLAKTSELETRKYELNKIALTRVLEKVLDYSNYSTVNWKKVDDLYYRPYNCDWGEQANELISKFTADMKTKTGKEYNYTPVLCGIWHKLQNAKENFKKQTTEARIIGSDKILKSIKHVEQGYDEVFLKIAQNYYGRAFVDYYNEIMPTRFQSLEVSFRNEINSNN